MYSGSTMTRPRSWYRGDGPLRAYGQGRHRARTRRGTSASQGAHFWENCVACCPPNHPQRVTGCRPSLEHSAASRPRDRTFGDCCRRSLDLPWARYLGEVRPETRQGYGLCRVLWRLTLSVSRCCGCAVQSPGRARDPPPALQTVGALLDTRPGRRSLRARRTRVTHEFTVVGPVARGDAVTTSTPSCRRGWVLTTSGGPGSLSRGTSPCTKRSPHRRLVA